MISSLRLRLLVGTSIATMAVFLVLGSAIFTSIRSALRSDFDAALLATANAVASGAEQDGHRIKFELDQQIPEFLPGSHSDYFRITTDDGRELARSPSLGKQGLDPVVATSDSAFFDAILPDGRPGRVLTLRFIPRFESDDESPRDSRVGTRPAVLTVARETRMLDATLSHIRLLLASLFGAAIVASGLTLLGVVFLAMRPVGRLARDIESIRESDLSARLPLKHVPRELLPMIERLNSLLARLDAAFIRERAFAADVAHELRTPLSGLHTTLQVSRSRPRDQRFYEMTMDKCMKVTAGMQSMVETLLLMARADAGQLVVERRPVDVCELIRDSWSDFQPRADTRALQVELRLPKISCVEADAQKLRIVLNNLFDNAVSHCNEGGTVRVTVDQTNELTTLQFRNTGSQVGPSDERQLFQRFWRGDAARSGTGVHCALGLSLCQRLVDLMGGRITAESREGIFSATISISHDISS